MRERNPLDGKRFGRVVVLHRLDNGKLLCKCDCGKEFEAHRSNITSGRQVSCGCYARELNAKRMTTHGLSDTKLYRVWRGIVTRCTNPNCKSFPDYGGRGISVCEAWLTFEGFYEWAIKAGYREGLQIDRKKNDGNYEPGNCSWVSQKENENNRRDTVMLTYNGKEKPLSILADECGINRRVLYDRIFKYGFSVEEAVSLPVKVGNNQSLRKGDK